MAKTVDQFQEEAFEYINNPENKIHLNVQKKKIVREEYLSELKKRARKEGLTEEEADDVCFLVEKALWGFGVLDALIEDPDISDIRLVAENDIRIKRLGKREGTDLEFNTKEEYERYIEFITNRNSTSISTVNAAQVFTDKDTCPTDILRFSLVSRLVNTNGRPTLLIRKIPKKKKTFDDLLAATYCTLEQRDYLIDRWKSGHGILVCGPNGSGKTTLTNALLDATPHDKSAVVIQESEELFCDDHPEMVFRKVIPPKAGSTIAYTLKDLSKLALMESFDIMIIGEIKGDEAADLGMATYTGSQSMTTVHSNSAAEGYEKIIDYALDAQPGRSRDHFAKQIQALDTAVFVKDYCIQEILESDGWDGQRQKYRLHPVNIRKPDRANTTQFVGAFRTEDALVYEEPKMAVAPEELVQRREPEHVTYAPPVKQVSPAVLPYGAVQEPMEADIRPVLNKTIIKERSLLECLKSLV